MIQKKNFCITHLPKMRLLGVGFTYILKFLWTFQKSKALKQKKHPNWLYSELFQHQFEHQDIGWISLDKLQNVYHIYICRANCMPNAVVRSTYISSSDRIVFHIYPANFSLESFSEQNCKTCDSSLTQLKIFASKTLKYRIFVKFR